jgi:arginase
MGNTVSFLGVPLELGAGALGAVMGPAALRTAGIARILREMGHQVLDHGDVATPPEATVAMDGADAERCRNPDAIAAWTRAVHDRAYELGRSGDRMVFLGGDHAVSMGTISAIARHCQERRQELVVLWLDAHADFNVPATSPSGNMHGMSVAFLSGEASLAPLLEDGKRVAIPARNFHIFGLRSVDPEERNRIDAQGIYCVDMRMIDEWGVFAKMRELLARFEGRDVHLHVSLDVDFLDPAIAPGVGTTVPGGATYREAHLIMELLHESGLVRSLDVVELNPFLDERGKSATLLAELVASLFGRRILHRR